MAEYGIKTVPDGMPVGPEQSDRMAESVPMSIAEAMGKMRAMQADTSGIGSTLGQLMPVPGPVSQAGNAPLLDSDGDFDYDKGPEIPGAEPTQDQNHASTAVQNG